MKNILFVILLFTTSLFAARTPEERKELFREATKRLKETKIEEKVPKKGDAFPNLVLNNKKVSEWVKDGPLVLTFYRGGWCPSCVAQLKEINASLKELKSFNADLIAVSPEKSSEVAKTKKKNDLDFTLISDPENKISRKLGLVFQVEDEVAAEYKNLGIDLSESQGNSKNELPIPGTFIIGQDQEVKYVHADADYTKRAPTSEIISELKKLR